MREREIKYMKMPVSQEEKRKLNAQGYKIVDERFAPKEEEQEQKPKRTIRRSKKES